MTQPMNSTKADLEIAFSGPAATVNKFFATRTNNGLRIAFTEQGSADIPPVFRSAVMLSLDDARALAELINNMAATH